MTSCFFSLSFESLFRKMAVCDYFPFLICNFSTPSVSDTAGTGLFLSVRNPCPFRTGACVKIACFCEESRVEKCGFNMYHISMDRCAPDALKIG